MAGALVLAASAPAAAPQRGATYGGTVSMPHGAITISLRVSADGGKVEDVQLAALPIYCAGNGPPGTPTIVFKSARVSAAGKFSSAGTDMLGSGPLKGSVAARLSVTGTFTSGGRLHGTLTTTFSGAAKQCGGHSPYTARA